MLKVMICVVGWLIASFLVSWFVGNFIRVGQGRDYKEDY